MKKITRHRILASFTFIALLILLAVQVNWLFNAAKIEEQNFNHKVTKALKEARDEIGRRVPECNNMMSFLCGKECQFSARQNTIAEIDSILNAKLETYNITLDYTFEITEAKSESSNKIFRSKCYEQTLNGLLEKNGIQIRLEFPGRNQFLLAQLKGAFLLAFFSIFFVMISFLLTFRMFVKEQQMVQHTTDFINNMVHEFQTPIANIRLATNLIRKKQVEPNAKVNEYTNVILKEGLKLEQHVAEILKVSCSGKENAKYELVQISEIIEQVVDDYRNQLDQTKGEIIMELETKPIILKGDSSHFKLIMSNLIDNAIKYSKGQPHITVGSKLLDKKVELFVQDKGIGIDKKLLTRIFEKYYRVSTGDVHNVKGFGLGLTYVKKMVEFYRGQILVTSKPGIGTIFTITLPLSNEQN